MKQQIIGILGGGQLGQMALSSFKKLGVLVFVLDPNPNCPCAHLADQFFVGSFEDEQDILSFAEKVDILTFEIEKVDLVALKKVEKLGKKVFPQPEVLQIIQDKGIQKQFFVENNIPTSPFVLTQKKEDLQKHIAFLPAVHKLRKGGYDGKGVAVIKNSEEIKNGFDVPSLLEKMVDIQQELSVIVVRDIQGTIQTFPTVGQVFDEQANLVKFVYAPAKIPIEIDEECQHLAQSVAQKLKIVGVLAVEFFWNTKGEVLVNEIAPRTHNSGHWSIEGANISQFEAWARILVGEKVSNIIQTKPTVMINLVAGKNASGVPQFQNFEPIFGIPFETFLESKKLNISTLEKNITLHWYGKSYAKPFRKMGHISVTGKTMTEALTLSEKIWKQVSIN